MSKIALNDVGNLIDATTSKTTINSNSSKITTALDNTLSRDGTSPNHMDASLDMNDNHIYNLPAPVSSTSPLRLEDLSEFTGGGTVTNIPAGGTTGQVLGKLSNDDFDVGFTNSVTSVSLALPTDFTITGSPVTSTGTLTGSWATTPTGTGAMVRAASPTLSGTVNINGSIVDTSGNITTPNLRLAGATSGTTSILPAAVASGTITVPAVTDTLVGKATTDTLTNKTLNTAGAGNVLQINSNTVSAITGTGNTVVLQTSPSLTTPTLGAATATTVNKVTITAPASAATLTIPDGVTLTGPAASGTAMTLGNTETVTGVKTFGSAGAVGRLKVAGTTSGTTILDATAAASGTLTLPAATDTLVGKATTDTLTNKTLTSPIISSISNTGTLTLPTSTDTLIGKATADTLTNKTFNTAGTGNVFQINGTGITAITGTTSVVLSSSPTITTPTIAIINNTGGVSIQGTNTNNSASSGYVGEYVTATLSSGSATSLTTAVAKTITSISLTAGDWDVYGYVNYVQAGTTNVTTLLTSLSLVDNTRGTEELVTSFGGSGITGGANPAGFTPFARMSLSGTTTVYLVARADFTVSTCSGWGSMRARRIR